MATFAPRPNENTDPWYGTRETYDQSLEDAIAANETALGGKLATADAPELIRDTMGTALVAGSGVTITPDDGADTITIAASGGGGAFGIGWKPLYYKGSEETIGATGVSTRSVTDTSRVHLLPFLISEPVTVSRIALEITTASASGSARLGIFTFDWPTQVATRVLDAGEVSTTAIGVAEATISQALDPGTYWLGFIVNQSCSVRALTGETRGFGQGAATGIAPATWLRNEGNTYGPFAATIATGVWSGTAGTPPRMLLRRG